MKDSIQVGHGYGGFGRAVLLFDGYREWVNSPDAQAIRESGSTSDFVTYLSNFVGKIFLERFRRADSTWRQWTRIISVPDYKSVPSMSFAGFPLLLKVAEGGEYKDAGLIEVPGPQMKVNKFGRRFSLTREVIINDDLNRLAEVPSMMADSAAASIAVFMVQTLLEANPNAYDGNPFFSVSPHNNQITDPLSETGLANALTLLRSQTDVDGIRIQNRASLLLVPVGLEFTARRILNSTVVPQPGTALGAANVMQGIIEYAVEPYLNDVNNWFVFADPNQGRPAVQAAFLQGMSQPQVMLLNPGLRYILGGIGSADPYTMEFDEIWWKTRYEWDGRLVEWRSAVRALVP